jgi:hypothetical protein
VFKRWKVTFRSHRGKYWSMRYYRRSKADQVASDYMASGMGQASVSKA